MAEVMKIATRDSYGTALVQLADAGHDDLVVFDADLSASTKTCVFQKAYPKRFFNCGIAEANMMGVAAGMSTFGYVPFVSSFAMFAAGRAWEQVRNSIGYPHLNVKIAATHGGLSVGEDGASHQCCEDFALMRAIPGMVVLCPADDVEARAAVKAAYSHEGPVYLRLSRLATPVFHDPDKYTFEIGKGETLTDGFDIAVISTGLMTSEVLKAAVQLKKQGSLSVRVINMPCIKPLDEDLVLRAAKECKKIITVEEHSTIGGLGEAVCSLLAEKCPTPVRRLGVPDSYGHSGPAWEVLKDFGLHADAIAEAIQEFAKEKAE
ncbi:MAG TPA: transketolase family protein [Candidatus Gemmiger avicola]|uniref:Transketolase family protein n=1 Tax=Candidatus Gemmiger avicola TaxID=2838605 RepID=A0A9D2M684_9FIRM|nr:transketolase family protein [Candidatus Gemmiger avicola]